MFVNRILWSIHLGRLYSAELVRIRANSSDCRSPPSIISFWTEFVARPWNSTVKRDAAIYNVIAQIVSFTWNCSNCQAGSRDLASDYLEEGDIFVSRRSNFHFPSWSKTSFATRIRICTQQMNYFSKRDRGNPNSKKT